MTREVVGSSPTSSTREPKLYCLARADLAVGLRTAQVGHALIAWTLAYGAPPANLVILAVEDETALEAAAQRVKAARCVIFHEPDLGSAATALAVGPEAWQLLSELPLLR